MAGEGIDCRAGGEIFSGLRSSNYKVFENFMETYKIPLVRSWLRFQVHSMSRFKTLSLPIFTAVVASTVTPARAELEFSTSTNKTYRLGAKGLLFNRGDYVVNLRDGNFIYQAGCVRPAYWPPNVPRDPCPLGSTGFLLNGALDEGEEDGSFFSVISVIPALAIEPRRPDMVSLIAAPASKLTRPSQGFSDNSYAMLYNLHFGSAPEYVISIYNKTTTYSSTQRSKFESEIVKGVYQYKFPRLKQPTIPAPLSATIFPMAEGVAKLNNKVSGFDFDGVLKKKLISATNTEGLPAGYAELSFLKPNTLTWKGLTPSDVYSNVDRLYFSIRVMENINDPASELDLTEDSSKSPQAIYPNFITGKDPRILLPSPYTNSFVVPPILDGGTRGVVQVELSRSFNTGGVAYDFSSRKFEVPIIVVNRYTDYREVRGIPKATITDDSDSDGFNNLNEWILDSDPRSTGSIPKTFRALNNEPRTDPVTFEVIDNQYFGFTVPVKLQTIPSVTYILQRSFDGGITWTNFVSDSNWDVTQYYLAEGEEAENKPAKSYIRVQSKYFNTSTFRQVRPPGTENETYRVKITL
jgi:hypothetical protein